MKETFVNYPPHTAGSLFRIELAGTSYCDGSYRIYREKASQLVIEYVIRGHGIVTLDEKQYTAKAGDIYLLPPGRKHLYYSDDKDPWEKVWFNASGTLIRPLLQEYNPQEIAVFPDAGGKEYFDQIHELGRTTACTTAQKHETAVLIFHQLLQHLYGRYYNQEPLYAKETVLIKEYLDNHFAENVSLKELSKMAYLSESQIIRIFKKDMGKTPYEYSLELRLEHAKKLLRDTRMMVKEISAALHFCDEHYFSYLFKQKVGLTPLQYRKKETLLTNFIII